MSSNSEGTTTTTTTTTEDPKSVKGRVMSHEEMDDIGPRDRPGDEVIGIVRSGGKGNAKTPASDNDENEVDEDPPIELEPSDIGVERDEGQERDEREPSIVGEPMEIEPTRSEDEDNNDLEALLGDITIDASSAKSRRKAKKKGCCVSKRVGNVIIVCQGCHSQTGYGTVGPHWFGPLCVLLIVVWASHHFVLKAMLLGPVSTSICVFFMLGTIVNLLGTSFKDPGVVTGRPPDVDLSEYRWCDFCNVYQPPDGAHCPDCNVCIAGYDHHCIWMGVCIGKGNMKSFVRFNLFWILYLLYSVLWVSVVGPIVISHLSA